MRYKATNDLTALSSLIQFCIQLYNADISMCLSHRLKRHVDGNVLVVEIADKSNGGTHSVELDDGAHGSSKVGVETVLEQVLGPGGLDVEELLETGAHVQTCDCGDSKQCKVAQNSVMVCQMANVIERDVRRVAGDVKRHETGDDNVSCNDGSEHHAGKRDLGNVLGGLELSVLLVIVDHLSDSQTPSGQQVGHNGAVDENALGVRSVVDGSSEGQSLVGGVHAEKWCHNHGGGMKTQKGCEQVCRVLLGACEQVVEPAVVWGERFLGLCCGGGGGGFRRLVSSGLSVAQFGGLFKVGGHGVHRSQIGGGRHFQTSRKRLFLKMIRLCVSVCGVGTVGEAYFGRGMIGQIVLQDGA